MSKIQERITEGMDVLQSMMENNAHLDDLESVVNKLAEMSLYCSHMNDEDRDYYDGVVWHLENESGQLWGVSSR